MLLTTTDCDVYKVLVLMLLLAMCSTVEAQVRPVLQGGFLLQKGGDTVAVERFRREENRLQGRMLLRQQVPVAYTAVLTTTNQLKRLEVGLVTKASTDQEEVVLMFQGDRIFSTTNKGGSTSRDTIAVAAGTMAYHSKLPMISLLEQLVMRARTMGGEQVQVPVFLLDANGQVVTSNIRFPAADSAQVSLGDITVSLKIGQTGKILAGRTSDGQIIKRLEKVPEAALLAKAPDYTPPPAAPYRAEQVRIQTKAGHVLAGTLTIPENVTYPVPVVVTITGSSPQTRDHSNPYGGLYHLFRQLADTLGRNGVAVLRMDDRGVGQSTGNFESATSRERADDIRAGMEFLRQHPAVNDKNMVLVGLSEGAMIAPMIASTDSTLSGIVLMAGPASSGEAILKYQLKNDLEASKELTAEQQEKALAKKVEAIRKKAKKDPWLRFFLAYDPLKTAVQVKEVPVLILQGTEDKQVPPADAAELEKAFRKAGNEQVTRRMFEGLNHVFLKHSGKQLKAMEGEAAAKVPAEVLGQIVAWVLKVTDSK